MQSLPDTPLTAQVAPGLLPRFQDGTTDLMDSTSWCRGRHKNREQAQELQPRALHGEEKEGRSKALSHSWEMQDSHRSPKCPNRGCQSTVRPLRAWLRADVRPRLRLRAHPALAVRARIDAAPRPAVPAPDGEAAASGACRACPRAAVPARAAH